MSGTYWATDINSYLEPKISSSGQGSIPAITIFDMLKTNVQKNPNKPALSFKREEAGSFEVWSWGDYYEQIMKFAKSLIALGFQPFDCTNIIGFNSKEWFVAQYGSMCAGGIPAGIYPSNFTDACKYISEHSAAKVVCVEDNKQLDKYITMGQSLSSLQAVVVWNERPSQPSIGQNIKCYAWEEFMELGNTVFSNEVEERMNAAKPGNCCSMIYTSGTTGPPKAAMISHDNVTWTVRSMLLDYHLLGPDERSITYLPMSHIAAQLLDMYLPTFLGSQVFFAQPDALRGSLGKTLKEVRPTYFFGVPRVWEKFYEKLQEIGKTVTGVKKSLSTWAKGRGSAKNRLAQYGQGGGMPCGFGIASTVVLQMVKKAIGMDQCKYHCTAAAPISVEVLNYFASLDIQIFEVFGQSETVGVHTVNTPLAWKIGTIGRPMLGTESKIVADTGELCVRGRHVFMGYYKMQAQTSETIDKEGWLHTGDVVTVDEDEDQRLYGAGPSGFMKITGRIKELIITAGGENIPPVLIENEFKKAMPALSNCMVIGDKRKFLSIILTLQLQTDTAGNFTEKLAGEALETSKRIGSPATTIREAKSDPLWTKYFDDGMKQANSHATSNAQKVAKWTLVCTDFSEKAGMLTPTLKLKRGPTAQLFSEDIEQMYR